MNMGTTVNQRADDDTIWSPWGLVISTVSCASRVRHAGQRGTRSAELGARNGRIHKSRLVTVALFLSDTPASAEPGAHREEVNRNIVYFQLSTIDFLRSRGCVGRIEKNVMFGFTIPNPPENKGFQTSAATAAWSFGGSCPTQPSDSVLGARNSERGARSAECGTEEYIRAAW
jgi:hypothetical protein